MAEKKTTPIVIDDVEYQYEDMTSEQQVLINHVADLDRKLRSTQFNLDQLNVGRGAFMNALAKSLTDEPETEEAA